MITFKTIALAVLFAICLSISAQAEYKSVTLLFDYYQPQDVEGFRIYFRSKKGKEWVKLWERKIKSDNPNDKIVKWVCSISAEATVDAPPGVWEFTARAFKGNAESGNSNIVTYDVKK